MINNIHQRSPRAGFTLVEIMIVVAIIALLAAIAVPNFMRARKRSQATMILEEARVLQDAMDQYAIDNPAATALTWPDLQPYIKTGSNLYNSISGTGPSAACRDILGNGFIGFQNASGDNCVGVSTITYQSLSDVAPLDFWSPYIPPALLP
jgi:prepilin-type N-terminal cleavage/methylation domain-containing protein